MSESKVYDSIMKEITAGLTGDPSKDMPYLQAKCAEYKEHEFGKEIIRACGRLMYDMIPDDKKEELKKVMQKDSLGIESALKEIKTNISEKNLEKALKNAESLVSRVEAANRQRPRHSGPLWRCRFIGGGSPAQRVSPI